MMELLCILAPSSVLQYVILNSDMIIRLFIVELGIYKKLFERKTIGYGCEKKYYFFDRYRNSRDKIQHERFVHIWFLIIQWNSVVKLRSFISLYRVFHEICYRISGHSGGFESVFRSRDKEYIMNFIKTLNWHEFHWKFQRMSMD